MSASGHENQGLRPHRGPRKRGQNRNPHGGVPTQAQEHGLSGAGRPQAATRPWPASGPPCRALRPGQITPARLRQAPAQPGACARHARKGCCTRKPKNTVIRKRAFLCLDWRHQGHQRAREDVEPAPVHPWVPSMKRAALRLVALAARRHTVAWRCGRSALGPPHSKMIAQRPRLSRHKRPTSRKRVPSIYSTSLAAKPTPFRATNSG